MSPAAVFSCDVVRRDGSVVPHDRDKLVSALTRCIEASVEAKEKSTLSVLEKTTVSKLANKVATYVEAALASGITLEAVNVGEINELCPMALMHFKLYEAAVRYVRYSDEKDRNRKKTLSQELVDAFDVNAKYFKNPLQRFQALDKFARYLPEKGRRENWEETVARTVGYFREHCREKGYQVGQHVWDELRDGLLYLRAAPSMRCIQMAGPALRRDQVGVFNCAFQFLQSTTDLAEELYILMQGTGVGFSVEHEYAVEKFPRVKRQKKGQEIPVHVVEDTTEGWCDAYKLGLNTWFNGEDITFDFSKVRLEGTPLKTKGGKASGPGPLKDLLDFSRSKILAKQGRYLSSVDLHDINCYAHRIVKMGGVRRASGISLSDLNDNEMRNCKHGEFWNTNNQRNQANNSAVYEDKPDSVTFMQEWLALAMSGSGERGIFNRGSFKNTFPKRRKLAGTVFGTNPCLTGESKVLVADGRGSVPIAQLALEGVDVPVFCVDDSKNVTVRMMRNPRVTGYQEPILKVTLDDGCVIRCTRNHRFMLRKGVYCQAQDLKPGDSLRLITCYEPEATADSSTSLADRYRSIAMGDFSAAEHTLIASFNHGVEDLTGYHVHHKNADRFDNSPGNLEVMPAASHLSEHSACDNNPNYSGVSNQRLKELGVNLCKSLGRRFSTNEWQDFAAENNLPQSFSSWRSKSLGTVAAFAKQCAVTAGVESFDNYDVRLVRTYKKLLAAGLNAQLADSSVLVTKQCEGCGDDFVVDHRRREQCFCGHSCSSKYLSEQSRAKQKKTHALTISRKREALQERQLDVYARLVNELGQTPSKIQWTEACKLAGVSFEISRKSSPFTSWKDLKDAAAVFNHRVVSVEEDGFEEVYNGTVDDHHNFLVGGWDGGFTKGGKHKRKRQWWIQNAQCGEIILRHKEFCNLSIAVVRPEDTFEDIKRKVELATIWGTLQATMTDFKYIGPEWKKNCEEERLLGVDLLGFLDHPLFQDNAKARETLDMLRQHAIEVNATWSGQLGINQSVALTCVKPSGDSSVLFDTAAGFKGHHGKYYVRRTRSNTSNPVVKMLKEAGVPCHLDYDGSGYVLEWPMKSPEGGVLLADQTAMSQLEQWKVFKLHWTEHNPSVTIYVRPDEWVAVGNWVYQNWDIVGGLSFLPYDGGVYSLAPYEEISEEDYNARMAAFPKDINWAKLVHYETEDMTDLQHQFACTGDKCTI